MPDDLEARDLTDLDELVRPLAGSDWWNIPASGDVPGFRVSDGPSGVRGQRFAGGPASVSFPCTAALGATWDTSLVGQVGAALADEARAKGAQVLLGPTINLQRTPLGGRHFECFSEDPGLTAHLASAYVRGLQGGGVAACVKHLVANDQEADRFEISSELDERTLREVALLPFEHALRGGAWSTMAAYNRLHGTHCSQNERLLTTILREEWGWDGVVISDWFAVHSTAPAVNAGLDLEMPGPPRWFGPPLAKAVADGEVTVATIERARARLRLLAERTKAESEPPGEERAGGSEAAVDVARRAAVGSQVLLKNDIVGDAPVLPLPVEGATIAVLGPNADREVIQGGGSARVTPTAVTTIADGLRERYGDRVLVEPGPSASRGTPALEGADLRRADGTVGVDVEILGGDGTVRAAVRPRDFRILFLDEPGDGGVVEGWSARGSATFTPRVSGDHRFKIKTNGTAVLRVDGAEVGEIVTLAAGQPVHLEVVASSDNPDARLGAELRCAPPEPADAFERAVAAAAAADAAVVVIGLDNDWETEGRDRESLDLPGRQVELARAVAAAQPRTAVLVVAGSPVDMSWAADVPAVMWCWLPGQEGGRAIADVLVGDEDPGGRLPCTLPASMAQTPALLDTPPDPGRIGYQEGVFCGHRWYDVREVEPAFPFGHGLSYTTFLVGAPRTAETIDAGGSVAVRVPVTNAGSRSGTTVVQLYVGDPAASVRRPLRELKAFAKVALDPGASTEVLLHLTMRDLAFWDPRTGRWTAEPGTFRLWAGQSSRDLSDPVDLTLTAEWTAGPADPLPA